LKGLTFGGKGFPKIEIGFEGVGNGRGGNGEVTRRGGVVAQDGRGLKTAGCFKGGIDGGVRIIKMFPDGNLIIRGAETVGRV